MSKVSTSLKQKALTEIQKQGALIIFPLANQKEPPSVWSALWPRSRMRWEWTENSDNRVAELWHLREQLSKSGRVVYTKWFRGRATVFAKDVFSALLTVQKTTTTAGRWGLSRAAREILELLESNSPLSTKEIKKQSGLRGKLFNTEFDRAMKELWSRFLIVGFGEVDDGAFPSLAVGATQLLFEDLWQEAQSLDEAQAWARLDRKLGPDSLFSKFLRQSLKKMPSPPASQP